MLVAYLIFYLRIIICFFSKKVNQQANKLETRKLDSNGSKRSKKNSLRGCFNSTLQKLM